MTQISVILHNDEFFKYVTDDNLTNNKTSTTESTGYVDDISHVSGNKDFEELEKTTDDLNKLVNKIYEENRLKVNKGKTQVLQIEANTNDALVSNRKMITIRNKGNIIKAKQSMKILGVTLNLRASMDSHLGRMKAKVGCELAKLKPYLSSMNPAD